NSIQFNSIQFNSIQFNSIQFNSIQFNSIQFNSIQFNSIQFNSIQFNSIQFNSIQFNSIQFNSIQFNSIQFNSIQFNIHFKQILDVVNPTDIIQDIGTTYHPQKFKRAKLLEKERDNMKAFLDQTPSYGDDNFDDDENQTGDESEEVIKGFF